jgi:hypothetical protein
MVLFREERHPQPLPVQMQSISYPWMKYKMCITSCQCWLQLLHSVIAVYDAYKAGCRIERPMSIPASRMISSETSISVMVLSLTFT